MGQPEKGQDGYWQEQLIPCATEITEDTEVDKDQIVTFYHVGSLTVINRNAAFCGIFWMPAPCLLPAGTSFAIMTDS